MIEFLWQIILAIFYGIIEGVTEWLPISSTGHLILIEQWLPLQVSEQFMTLFRVVIQLGAIGAVMTLGFKQLWPFRRSKKSNRIVLDYQTTILWLKIIVACLPAAIIGLLFDDVIDKYLYNAITVAIALIVFGIFFILVEKHNQNRTIHKFDLKDITWQDAIIIGLFQVLAAVFPGTSRSGATILGGIIIGLSRPLATQFTFFLGIPVMFGASLLKMIKVGLVFSIQEWFLLLVGSVTAFLVSIVVIGKLLHYVKRNDFTAFGIYRIILGILVLVNFMI